MALTDFLGVNIIFQMAKVIHRNRQVQATFDKCDLFLTSLKSD